MNKTRVRLVALLLAVSFALSGCSLVKNIGGSGGAGTKTITRPAVESAELQFTHPIIPKYYGHARQLGWIASHRRHQHEYK